MRHPQPEIIVMMTTLRHSQKTDAPGRRDTGPEAAEVLLRWSGCLRLSGAGAQYYPRQVMSQPARLLRRQSPKEWV